MNTRRVGLFLVVVVFAVAAAQAATTWTAGTSGYWTNPATWGGGGIPTNDDAAVINNAITVTLDNATASLNTFTNNGVLVFEGWSNAVMTATVVQVFGTITHLSNTDTSGVRGVYADWAPDNRVQIVCSNLTVAVGGKIDANGKGYAGGWTSGTADGGKGPGGGNTSDFGSGGGYGNIGGSSGWQDTLAGGAAYGSVSEPTDPGSGGAAAYNYVQRRGGRGGGAVRIVAAGHVEINGSLSADGSAPLTSGDTAGGGSGGSIYISSRTFGGSGAVTSRGGGGNPYAANNYGGGGSGGRIAVVYDAVAQSNAPASTVRFDLQGGFGSGLPPRYAPPGTFYARDCRLVLTPLVTNNFSLHLATNGAWEAQQLTVSNAWFILNPSVRLNITNDLTVTGGNGRFELTAASTAISRHVLITNQARMTISGDAALTNAALLACQSLTVAGTSLTVQASASNGVSPVWGTLIVVSNVLSIAPNAALVLYSHPTNGGSVKFMVGSLNVASNGTIDAEGKGYRGYLPAPSQYVGYGPGGGGAGLLNGADRGPGAGHGGRGGADSAGRAGGATYGSSNAPTAAGSAGYNGASYNNTYGPGGGVVWVEAQTEVRVDGTLSANGGAGREYAGGGAGGSIYVTTETLSGGGRVLARGGNGGPGGGSDGGGGGGGGRIALWSSFSAEWSGTYSVTNGTQGYTTRPYGSNGTFVLGYIVPNRPGISNGLPSSIAVGSADLNGYLFTTGRSDTAAMVYWGTQDQGTNAALWANTNDFPAPQSIGPLVAGVTFPAVETMYYYRYHAVNGGGESWPDNTRSFLAGFVSFNTLSSPAREQGLLAATVSVVRAETATNGPLTVLYTVGGTAIGGTDYAALSGSVLIPAGQTNALIVVRPLYDGGVTEGDETVTLTLATTNYLLGASNAVTIPLIDFVIPPGVNTNVGSGAWNDIANWSIGRPPIAGDTVTIATSITVDVSVGPLPSLTVLAGAALTFSGSNTRVTAETVNVYGTLTHITNSATASPWTPDGRVWLVCSNFTLAASGAINLDGRGYLGPINSAGFGPGGGGKTDWAGGGGHGGAGGPAWNGTAGGAANDDLSAPVLPGSSGGAAHPYTVKGGSGGGAVRLEASGQVRVDGLVTANGEDVNTAPDNTCGGGAGGSVYITCRTFAGSNAAFRAWGGYGSYYFGIPGRGGGGGGGRIAIVYDTAAQAGVSPLPNVSFELRGGIGGRLPCPRTQQGSLYLSDASFYNPSLITNAMYLVISNRTTWTPASIEVRDAWFTAQSNLGVTVSGPVQISGSEGKLELLSAASLSCTSLLVTNAGRAYFYAGPTNGVAPAYGGSVNVNGSLRITSNSVVYAISDATNGGSVRFTVNNLTVDLGGQLNADGSGFRGFKAGNTGMGPGGGGATDVGAGAGYGGAGGTNQRGVVGGGTYGSLETPLLPGSAGGRASGDAVPGGPGGGLVWVEADTIVVDGVVSANGQSQGSYGGGGSGGGVYLYTRRFNGTGRLEASGGAGAGGAGAWPSGGGGGRIAVWRVNSAQCTTAVTGGVGWTAGQIGTVYWGQLPPKGSLFLVR
jgi:hypothetical protein